MGNNASGDVLALLRLVSPTLPVGGYSYSRGLESAVELGYVVDAPSAEDWIEATVGRTGVRVDCPMIPRLHRAFLQNDLAEVTRLAGVLRALRESHELLAEDRNMGEALGRLLCDLGHARAEELVRTPACGFCVMFALAAVDWGVSAELAMTGYLWLVTESQVNAAVRLVPLGQTDGQRMLGRLSSRIPAWQQTAAQLDEEDLGGFLPGLAMASALHETQYARLFRS